MIDKSRKSAIAITIVCAMSTGLSADEEAAKSNLTLTEMFTMGKVSGQIREFSISRSVDYSDVSKTDYTRRANAIGGYLKYETAELNGLRLGIAGYTTNGFLLGNPKTDYTIVDPTLLGKDNENCSILGEAYIEYKQGNTSFKGGRQKLKTPMAAPDDVRMLPNLFEAYMLENSDIPGITLIGGHITRFSQGTFGRAENGGVDAATTGYSYVNSRDQVGAFVNIGSYAVGTVTDGVSVAAIKYDNAENFKMQVWDYYAYDILNIIYAEAGYAYKGSSDKGVKPFASVQFINENAIGKKYIGEVASQFLGFKTGLKVENISAYAAYTATSKNGANDSTLNHAVVSMWGGMPAFAAGMVSRHMFLAGTKAIKAAVSYAWKDLGVNLKTTLYTVKIYMDPYNGSTYGDASETGFDCSYSPMAFKNLQLRLRANFPRDFKVDSQGGRKGWDEYRLIVNYDF